MKNEDRSVFELAGRAGDVTNSYGVNPDQVIELFNPTSQMIGDVALIHGGYWRPEYDRVHLRPLAQALADLGFRVHLIEYRRIPGNPDATIEDIKNALNVIGDCVLVGHSAGGHLSLIAQSHESVRAVVALAPVSNLFIADSENYDEGAVREFLGCVASERPDLNPIVNSISKPTIFIHGADDIRVPIAQSREFLKAHPTIGYIELEGIGHFELIDPRQDAFALLTNELKKFA